MFLKVLVILASSLLLVACASSNLSRDVASNIDLGAENAKKMFSGDADLADVYQNINQASKGAILGGTAGAITGALASGIGIIPATATGAMLGASYGNYIDANTTLRDELINRGVSIVELGDQMLIVLPSSRIFKPMSATIKSQAYQTLNLVACYINCFKKMLVKIAAYTNTQPCGNAMALSDMQAKRVEKFLWESGINARLLYSEGYGGTHLLESTALGWDASLNYRVEITFEKLYV